MSKKFQIWLSAEVARDQHSANATVADLARMKVIGKDTLAEKHLRRISQREQTLSEFAGHVADSQALFWIKDEDE